MVMVTSRREWIERMEQAGADRVACWIGFYDACVELSNVASESQVFNAAERKAAIALEIVARLEAGYTQIMRSEFRNQYQILGAPGDFGYDTDEGRAMQAVYEWWNKLVQLRPVATQI